MVEIFESMTISPAKDVKGADALLLPTKEGAHMSVQIEDESLGIQAGLTVKGTVYARLCKEFKASKL